MKKEPLIHITRNMNVTTKKKWISRVIAIFAGFIICSLMSWALGADPVTFFTKIVTGCFVEVRTGGLSKTKIMDLLEGTAILMLIAVALTPAFKMKFWNIGAEGQIFVGILMGAVLQKYLGLKVPAFLFFLITFVVCALAGALWGAIPAVFKAYFGTNETLFTLMMNYIAICIVKIVISKWSPLHNSVSMFDKSLYLNTYVAQGAKGVPNIINILIVILLCVGVFFYLTKFKHGYEIAVVGGSENTARYVGMNIKWVTIRTMLVSGGICGIVGFLLICGEKNALAANLTQNRGFTGVMISWLSSFNIGEMGLYSFLFSWLNKGCRSVSSSESFPGIISSIFVFVVIATDFFTNYKVNFRKKTSQLEEVEAK